MSNSYSEFKKALIKERRNKNYALDFNKEPSILELDNGTQANGRELAYYVFLTKKTRPTITELEKALIRYYSLYEQQAVYLVDLGTRRGIIPTKSFSKSVAKVIHDCLYYKKSEKKKKDPHDVFVERIISSKKTIIRFLSSDCTKDNTAYYSGVYDCVNPLVALGTKKDSYAKTSRSSYRMGLHLGGRIETLALELLMEAGLYAPSRIKESLALSWSGAESLRPIEPSVFQQLRLSLMGMQHSEDFFDKLIKPIAEKAYGEAKRKEVLVELTKLKKG